MEILNSIEKNLKVSHILIASILIEAILFYLYYFPEAKVLVGDEVRYLSTANSILKGGDWHPSPMWPPLAPIIIAGFLKISNDSLFPLQLFQYLVLIASGFILKNIVFRETNSEAAAKLALAFMILYPSWLAYSHYLWPEVIHVFTFLSVVWINNYRYYSYRWLIIAGLLIAIMLLLKSLTLLFIPFLFYKLYFNKKHWLKKTVLPIVLQLIVAGIVLSPVALKSYEKTGSYMISNSSMFNFNFGIQEDSRQSFVNAKGGKYFREYMQSAKDFAARDYEFKNNALEKIKQQGYLETFFQQFSKQYFRLFEHQSFLSIQFNGDKQQGYKGKYFHRFDDMLVKLLLFFDKAIYLFMMVFAVFGLVYSVKHSHQSQQFALFLIYNLALFLVLHAKTRFRMPLIPAFAFYSAYFFYFLKNIQNGDLAMLNLLKSKLLTFLAVALFTLTLIFIFLGPYLDKSYPI